MPKIINSLYPSYTPHLIEAGVDEVGRGCLAGPVVAAAVILPKDFYHPRLTDSKLLSEDERESIRVEILDVALDYYIAEISHTEIDRVNILNASYMAMHSALDGLRKKPELLLIDGNRFAPYQFIPHKCIVKGDSKYFSIAAASVLAKCYRDKMMRQLALQYPGYGWESNVGYATKSHRKGLELYGPTSYHRMTFTLLPEEVDC